MAKKSALGKGLDSLIKGPSVNPLIQNIDLDNRISEKFDRKNNTEEETGVLMVNVDQITANDYQPRKIFKDDDLRELSESIKENGILQPLIVTKDGNTFRLIAGERRLRASKLAKVEQVPVVVKKVTDKEKLVFSIIENVQRSDLNCIEEGLAYFQLMDDFKLTQEEVAKKIGKDRSTIANHLRILKLPREVISLLQKEAVSFGHAKILASVKDRDEVIRLATQCQEEGLSVRELERLTKETKIPAQSKDRNDPILNEKMDALKDSLEKRTGFHIKIKPKSNGSGQILINYSDENEFNNIYDFILSK